MEISFAGIGAVLGKYMRNRRHGKYKNWQIATIDTEPVLSWAIFYKQNTVLQCINGELQGGFRPFPEFDDAAEQKLRYIVREVYGF